jgi:hypothetical protein
MLEAELEALQAEVVSTCAARIAPKSRTSYRSSTIRFLKWLFSNKPELLLTEFVSDLQLDGEGPTSTSLKRTLSLSPANPPIDFDQLTALNFSTWVFSMKGGWYMVHIMRLQCMQAIDRLDSVFIVTTIEQ